MTGTLGQTSWTSLSDPNSTYFKNTLREPNMVNENKIYFDDEDPAAVALFVGWLYRGSIPEVAAMEKKIRYSIPPGSSVPPESTLNGNTAPGKVPHIMNGQASPKLPATPTLPATSKPAVQTFMSPSTTSLSPLGKISQTPTPVFGHPRQNTSNALPPASLPNASATPNPASSRDPEREALQLALLHLCLFTAKPQWPDPFNLAIESYCRIVAARVIPPDQVELAYKYTTPHVLPLREYIIDHISQQPNGEIGHLVYMSLAKKCPDLMSDLFQRLRFPATIARYGFAENCLINPYKKYHMRDAVDG
ncbi:hypothetical protein ACMFMG_003914 [Clarireedia jacksonii]